MYVIYIELYVAKLEFYAERRERCVRNRFEERRVPRDQGAPDQRPEPRAQPGDLEDRPARHVRDAGVDVRLEPEELHAVDAAERLAGVGDPRAAQVGRPVAVDVDAAPDHLHELHQVDRRLAQAVAAADERLRANGAHALGGVDGAVAVLVDAPPLGSVTAASAVRSTVY